MNGEVVCSDVAVTTGKPVKLNLRLDNAPVKSGKGDVAIITCFCTDEDGAEVPTATPFVSFNTNGLGKIIATGSDVCDHSPVTEPCRKMRAGRITVAVSVGNVSGILRVHAESENYIDGILDIEVQ